MGIFGALTTAVGGLQAQAFALDNIAGNIANSQTTAFKRVDTSFSDLVGDPQGGQQQSGGVTAISLATNTVQGAIQAASVGTYMAINGDGYFVVQQPAGSSNGGTPIFTNNDLYTRRGDFQLDKNGYLVNGAGYYLEGLPIDPTTGNVTGSQPTVLQVSNNLLPAQVTTAIQYGANLAATPITPASSAGGSELLVPGDFNQDPTTAGAGAVEGDDVATFLNESISGGSVTVYDPQGNPVNVQLRWAKTDSQASGGTDTWNLFYQTDSNPATATTTTWVNAGTDFKFGANGQMTPPVSSVTFTALAVDNHTVGDVTLNIGANGLTQFADPNGVAQVNTLSQNGYAAGQLNSISVNSKGTLVASYSNGRTLDIAEIPLVSFHGEDGLKSLNGGAFAATDESGPAITNASGTIVSQSLEGSNTDISSEFTKLITTQQAYSANTKIVTTADQMMQDTLNMLR